MRDQLYLSSNAWTEDGELVELDEIVDEIFKIRKRQKAAVSHDPDCVILGEESDGIGMTSVNWQTGERIECDCWLVSEWIES